ncbi:hypothetical protein ccbrp13_29550 [Ktedonobacteria bacterium brp13]|nr:hypothetical protein ccbrp13_29550 [Ktedonobacteria bacterium brp13]
MRDQERDMMRDKRARLEDKGGDKATYRHRERTRTHHPDQRITILMQHYSFLWSNGTPTPATRQSPEQQYRND